jgi:hypothetical protein
VSVLANADLASVILSATQTEKIRSQINRSVVLLSLLRTKIVGDPIAWDVEFTSTRAAASQADTAAAPTATKDIKERAVLSIGEYVTTAGVTGRAASAAAASLNPIGVSGDSSLLASEVSKGVKQTAKQMAADLYAATGSSSSIVGMATAIDATGTYANLAQSTYSEWASTEQTGALAALSFEMIDTLFTAIYTTAGERPDFAVTTPTILSKLKTLYGPYQSYVSEIMVGGQTRKLMSGARALNVEGLWCIEDPDCTASTIYALNDSQIEIGYMVQAEYLNALANPDIVAAELTRMIRERGGTETVRAEEAAAILQRAMNGGIMPYLKRLGPTGNQENIEVICYPQLRVLGRKFHGKLTLS